jgi:hypothetical protein
MFSKFNENESTSYKELWDTGKAVIRGKFITMNTYIESTERSQINGLMLHHKLLENYSNFNSLKTNNQRIDSTKEVKEIHSEYCKSLKEEIDQDYRRWKVLPCS